MRCKYLIDTVIFIDHLKRIPEAVRWLSSLKEGEGAISVVTFTETLVGTTPKEEDELHLLMDHYLRLDIDFSIAQLTADLRRQWKWKLPDAFQAALAMQHQLRLVTRNTKDFSPKVHSFVHVPYE